MSVIGLRVGPFEIVEKARIPEPGDWYYARRAGQTRRHPNEVLVRLLDPNASSAERADLQRQFDILRGIEDGRIPTAVALYEGIGALAVHAVRGTPLTELVTARAADEIQMTPSTLLDIALEIAETLQHMHHTGNVHGHLSGDNVLLAPDGKVWLFGIGQGADATASDGWQAPERARGEAPTQATDQWSLAAICSALVTGHAPWRSDDPSAEAVRGDAEAVIEPVMTQWPALARLLQRLLDGRPENRHPNMHPVRQELLALSRKAGGTSDRRDLGTLLAERISARQVDEAEPPADAGPEPLDKAVEAKPAQETVDFTSEETWSPDTQDEGLVSEDPPSQVDLPVAAMAEDAEIPEPERKPPEKLPEEEIPVVRPDVKGEVPTAQLGSDENTPEPEDGTFEAESEDKPAMSGPEPDAPGSEPDSNSDVVGDTPDSLDPPEPKLDPPDLPVSKPLSLMDEDEDYEEDDEEATVLFGREAIDRLINEAKASAPNFKMQNPNQSQEDIEIPPGVNLGPPKGDGPTAVPTTDSRDPSEEIPRPGLGGAVDASDLQEPGLGTGQPPRVGTDMPSGPALGNPEEIVAAKDLPDRNMTAQRVAMGLVVLLGLAMLGWMLSQMI